MNTLKLPILLALFLSLTSCKEDKGSLSGTVSDLFNKPLANATVSIVGSQQSVRSDKGGHYQLSYSPGSLEFIVEAKGYLSAKRSLNISETMQFELDPIQLIPRPPEAGAWRLSANGLQPVVFNPVLIGTPLGMPSVKGRVMNLSADYQPLCSGTPLLIATSEILEVSQIRAVKTQGNKKNISIGGPSALGEVPIEFQTLERGLYALNFQSKQSFIVLMGQASAAAGSPQVYTFTPTKCRGE